MDVRPWYPLRVRATASLSLLVGVVASTVPAPARACSCAHDAPVRLPAHRAFARSDAVFEGRVVDVEYGPEGDRRATLDVVQQWKGVDHERVVVTTSERMRCGIPFAVGTSWLVYARRIGDELTTGSCWRTRPVEEAQEDLAALGAGVVPVDITDADEVEEPAPARAPAHGGCASCAVGASRVRPPAGVLPSALWLPLTWLLGWAFARRARPQSRSVLQSGNRKLCGAASSARK